MTAKAWRERNNGECILVVTSIGIFKANGTEVSFGPQPTGIARHKGIHKTPLAEHSKKRKLKGID